MYSPAKKIRIAVIGTRSSGKSFLLYDMIHAFSILGYHPESLPLDYPHSSFGTFFYDIFNKQTGGMRGTEMYACRTDDHYGAYLSGNSILQSIPNSFSVDFLNIPGEIFMPERTNRIDSFFKLKRLIEKMEGDLFRLSIWKEEKTGHRIKLLLPKDLNLKVFHAFRASQTDRYGNYMTWNNILYILEDENYHQISNRRINGKYIFEHITELNTDSVICTIEACWGKLNASKHGITDWELIKKDFYHLAYCQMATDIVICSRLPNDIVTESQSILPLAEVALNFLQKQTDKTPHVYMAFRCADSIIYPDRFRFKSENDLKKKIKDRNNLYTQFVLQLQKDLESGGNMPESAKNVVEHIKNSVGTTHEHPVQTLLNFSYREGTALRRLLRHKTVYELFVSSHYPIPPHVYFTTTPIDSGFHIYENDTNDVTRFYYKDEGGRKSFTREIQKDMSNHLCFGSLQLLTDILLQNRVVLLKKWVSQRGEILKYLQYRNNSITQDWI